MLGADNSDVKILIISDMPENIEIVSDIFETEGYNIHIANSEQAAISMLDDVQVDIILLDIITAVINKSLVFKYIKENPRLGEIPIIFLIDNDYVENVDNEFEYDTVDYIRKPFNFFEVTSRVKNYAKIKRIKEELESKNKKLEEVYAELNVVATTDPITKLINRREMLKKIEYEIIRFERNKTKFALIMADIDFFKKVNDNYGHGCGNFILKGVADLIKEGIRRQDFVARWDNDEFLLLLPDTTQNGASILAEKIRSRIEQVIFKFDGKDIKITMTFGVSDYLENKEGNEVVKLAEKALYNAKKNGKNCIVLNEIEVES